MLDGILFGAFAVLQLLDAWTTKMVLSKGTQYREANPAVRWLIGKVGMVPALFGMKLVFIAAVGVALAEWPSIFLEAVIVLVSVGYVYIVINNFKLWRE